MENKTGEFMIDCEGYSGGRICDIDRVERLKLP